MGGAARCCQQGLPGQLHDAADAPFGLEVVLALFPVCDVQLDVFSAQSKLRITASSKVAATAAGTAQHPHRRPPRFETFFLKRSTLQVEVKACWFWWQHPFGRQSQPHPLKPVNGSADRAGAQAGCCQVVPQPDHNGNHMPTCKQAVWLIGVHVTHSSEEIRLAWQRCFWEAGMQRARQTADRKSHKGWHACLPIPCHSLPLFCQWPPAW